MIRCVVMLLCFPAVSVKEFDGVIIGIFTTTIAGAQATDFAAAVIWDNRDFQTRRDTFDTDIQIDPVPGQTGSFYLIGSHDYGSSTGVFAPAAMVAYTDPLTLETTYSQSAIGAGDFDESGLVDAEDIDALYVAMSQVYTPALARFDLNRDSQIAQDDAIQLVNGILHTQFGDANLDWFVDFVDFQALLDHWQGSGGWADADFTGDGNIDYSDYQVLLDCWNPTGSAMCWIDTYYNPSYYDEQLYPNLIVLGFFFDAYNMSENRVTEVISGVPLYDVSVDWGGQVGTATCKIILATVTLDSVVYNGFYVLADCPAEGIYANVSITVVTLQPAQSVDDVATFTI